MSNIFIGIAAVRLKSISFITFLWVLSWSATAQKDTLIRDAIEVPGGDWKLVFSEEFSDTALNKQEWLTYFPYTDDGSDQCAFCRTHGNENQVFLDRNVVLSDGMLHIVAKREQATWFDQHRNYTSGMIHSRQAFGHGRYEVRAKLPSGKGFWPGIWTFGQLSAEIDIMEAGMQHPKRFHTSVHNWVLGKMVHKRIQTGTDLSDDFHVYAMEWEPDFIRFFIDDKEVWNLCRFTTLRGRNIRRSNIRPGRYRIQPVFPALNEKLFFIIGMGIGNETTPFTGTPDEDTVFPNQFMVDYIRIYQRNMKPTLMEIRL